MTSPSVAAWCGIGPRSLVAIVGAGGKTTTMHSLAGELRARGERALIGTTTKIGRSQHGGLPLIDADLIDPQVLRKLDGGVVMSGSASNDEKLGGPAPEWFDAVFEADGLVDHLVLEADGARHHNVKAPGPGEPVIPSRATHVIAVIGADALDRVIEDQAHHPMRVAAVAGCSPYDRLTTVRAARLLTDAARGSRKGTPSGAWFGVLISKVGPVEQRSADELGGRLRDAGVPSLRVPRH